MSVSAPDGEGDAAVAEALFPAIAEARVGGRFWAAPAPEGRFAAVSRPCSRREALAQAVGEGHLVILPRAGWARGLAPALERRGATVVVGAIDPWSLFGRADRFLLAGDDEWAALAIIAGQPLSLTSDGTYAATGEGPAVARRRVADRLVEARYRDPFTGGPADLAATIARLADWRAQIDVSRRIAVAAGIAWWKRDEIGRFLWAPARPLRFRTAAAPALRIARRQGGGIAAWPSRVSPRLIVRAEAEAVPLSRIEDGFIRSVGLGSNLHPPFSVVVDGAGIYYDPTRPSDLETLLATAAFPPALTARAAALRSAILRTGISKYGVGAAADLPARASASRRLVLVPGQVEDDLSVLRGGGAITGNLDLLRRVRALEPEAEIWFRPHPDVDAGHRRGAIADADALAHADRVVRGGAMAALLDRIDGVHVLTSLTGFEALLRGRDVTTHGVPFFAGWGLTRDHGPVPARRGRSLTLDELVAATLILYPRYLDPVTRLPCPPELLIARFAEQRVPRPTWLIRLRRLQGRLTGLWR